MRPWNGEKNRRRAADSIATTITAGFSYQTYDVTGDIKQGRNIVCHAGARMV